MLIIVQFNKKGEQGLAGGGPNKMINKLQSHNRTKIVFGSLI